MKFKTQTSLASRMLGVGAGKIKFDPLRLEDVSQAITRADIAELIKDRAIRVKPTPNRTKVVIRKRKGVGRTRFTVSNRKRDYINKIRKMRRHLQELHDKGDLALERKNRIRRLAKAGQFRNLKHMKESMKTLK
jgi:large subunit ribosomal protein L19e